MTLVGDNFNSSDYLNQLLGKNKPAEKKPEGENNYFENNAGTGGATAGGVWSDLDSIIGGSGGSGSYNPTNDPLAEYEDLFNQVDKDISEAKQTAKEVAETLKIKQAEAEQNKQSMQKAIDSAPAIHDALKNGSAAEKKAAITSIENMKPAERRELEKAYALKNADGNPLALRSDLRKALSGAEETKAFDLMNEGIQSDPKMSTVALFEALDGDSVDKRTVSTIINNASPAQLKSIQSTFDKTMKKDGALADMISDKFSGAERTELLNKLQ